MQTILGSGGAIGIELARELKKYTPNIRLVSRNPQKFNADDQLFAANLTNLDEVLKAVEGSEIVYLTAGIKYSLKAWQKNWPVIMRNTIEACKTHKSKLVFFDNIYMYDPNYLDKMDESTPINPISKKGEVRKQIAEMLMSESAKGNIEALIARSADYYGSRIKGNSILTETVFNNLKKGKKAMWLESLNFKHSFTYTPDAGQATAILGNTPDAYNQVWHLPTSASPFTGKEWIEAIANEMGVRPGFQVASKFMVRLIGLFVPVMREVVEMMYQYNRDYTFVSEKFEKKFNFAPTPYLDGIKTIVETDYK